jgi:hypothetical protein
VTIPDDEHNIIPWVERGKGFRVLGSIFTFDGNDRKDLHNRADATKRLFCKYRRQLTNKRISVNKRMMMAEKLLRPCMLWNCASWNLRSNQVDYLQSIQNTIHRTIVGVKVCADKFEWPLALSEAYRKVHFLRAKLHITDWKDAYRECSYRWAGPIGRMTSENTSALLARVLLWRGAEWSNNME